MKKAILVSCFGWYKDRLIYVKRYLEDKGYSVSVYNSDFNHITKTEVDRIEGIEYIHVSPYLKNLSIKRLYSHWDFSQKISKILKANQPDIVYALLPPNSVALVCGKYKKNHPNSKLIFDIIDMWPESYTAPKILEAPFKVWASLRDNNLKCADHIFTECELYQDNLEESLIPRMSTLRLFREYTVFTEGPKWDGKEVVIGYLGSINSLLDIELVARLISEIAKVLNVRIHIVGGGINTDYFINALAKTGALVENHGVVFDKDKMHTIIGQCHFAINMMKPSVCVGLTIKSMDYFQMGVPMLNTIKGDTKNIINDYHCGYNIDDVKLCGERMRLLNQYEYQQMRQRVQKAFVENLTLKAFINNMEAELNKIINCCE